MVLQRTATTVRAEARLPVKSPPVISARTRIFSVNKRGNGITVYRGHLFHAIKSRAGLRHVGELRDAHRRGELAFEVFGIGKGLLMIGREEEDIRPFAQLAVAAAEVLFSDVSQQCEFLRAVAHWYSSDEGCRPDLGGNNGTAGTFLSLASGFLSSSRGPSLAERSLPQQPTAAFLGMEAFLQHVVEYAVV